MKLLAKAKRRIESGARKAVRAFGPATALEVDVLYKVLYDRVHDLDCAFEVKPRGTIQAFGRQWTDFPEGDYLLSDPWFRENVDRILVEQEVLVKSDWFRGRRVLDAGCGNGRWAYGFCKLGAEITCVDANESAITAAERALRGFANPKRFILSELEELDAKLLGEVFDLVFCWGVLHHCVRFNRSLGNVAGAVRDGGLIYLGLYGRDSLPIEDDLEIFKKRVAYSVLLDEEQRRRFLLREARGEERRLHELHDVFAPLVNRRFRFDEVKAILEALGFGDVCRTVDHTEVMVRAIKGKWYGEDVFLPPKRPPYWFQGRRL